MTNSISLKLNFIDKLFFFIVLLFLIGPNIKFIGAEIHYWVYLFFIIYIYIALPKTSTQKIPQFILFPSLVIFLSLVLKLLLYNNIIMRDILDTMRYVALVFVYLFTVKMVARYSVEKLFFIIQKFIKLIIVSLAFVSILGLLQYFSFDSFMNYFSSFYEEEFANYGGRLGTTNFSFSYQTERVTSIYYTPLAFGAFLVFFLTIIVSYEKRTFSVFGVISLGLLALILSNARSPLIAFVIGMLFYFSNINKKKGLMLFAIIVGFILLVLSFNFISSKNIGRFEEVFTFFADGMNWSVLPSTLLSRFYDISTIWGHFDFSKHFIAGMPNDYYETYLYGVSFQSQYFSWLIKFGLCGVLLSGWLIYMFFKFSNFYKSAVDKHSKKLLLMMTTLFLINILMSITQQSALGARWREILFMLIALVFTHYEKIKKNIGFSVL
jgi:hypothetical protein